jgi:hypothetical protein
MNKTNKFYILTFIEYNLNKIVYKTNLGLFYFQYFHVLFRIYSVFNTEKVKNILIYKVPTYLLNINFK